MDQQTRQRALSCLGEARYDLREAAKLYENRYGPVGHIDLSAVAELWAEMDDLARQHMTGAGPSGHEFSEDAVSRMSIDERFELHRAEHLGSGPLLHMHEMDPFSAGLG